MVQTDKEVQVWFKGIWQIEFHPPRIKLLMTATNIEDSMKSSQIKVFVTPLPYCTLDSSNIHGTEKN